MKITRPALAAVAAVAIAAGAVPAAGHFQAAESSQGLVTVERVQPAVSESTSSLPTSTETTPAATTNASATTTAATTAAATTTGEVTETTQAKEPKDVADIDGASVPDGDREGLLKQAKDALKPEATGEEADNMPEPAESDTESDAESTESENFMEIAPLTEAPVDYKGNPQEWFAELKNFRGAEAVTVYSEAMDRKIPVALIRAVDKDGNPIKAPTYYLLNGAGGSEQNTDWLAMAPKTVRNVLGNEPVNVVIPMEGAFSYYVDWLSNPGKGKYFKGEQKWSTFLAKEMIPSVENYLDANGKRAVTGFSMSATSSLLLAVHNPDMFDAVGSFSGCAATSTPLPNFFAGLTVNRGSAGAGNITPENLWGPRGSDYNRYNDALVMADNLVGENGVTKTKFYLSAGTGLAGQTDMLSYLRENSGSTEALSAALTLQVEGGAIEAAMNACTHDFNTKLNSLGVDTYFNKRPVGTHSWPLWRDDLKVSWEKVIRPALFESE